MRFGIRDLLILTAFIAVYGALFRFGFGPGPLPAVNLSLIVWFILIQVVGPRIVPSAIFRIQGKRVLIWSRQPFAWRQHIVPVACVLLMLAAYRLNSVLSRNANGFASMVIGLCLGGHLSFFLLQFRPAILDRGLVVGRKVWTWDEADYEVAQHNGRYHLYPKDADMLKYGPIRKWPIVSEDQLGEVRAILAARQGEETTTDDTGGTNAG